MLGRVWGRCTCASLWNARCFHTAPALWRPFKLPDIGEGIAEVEVLEVFIKPGDKLEHSQNMFHVQSDKASVEITSPFEGTVTAVHFGVGDVAPTGSILCDVDVDGEEDEVEEEAAAPPEPAPEPASGAPAPPSPPPASTLYASGKVLAAPATRRLAKEHGLDLDKVPATGKDGRVLKGDILAYLDGGVAHSQAETEAPVDSPLQRLEVVAGPVSDTVLPVKGIQKAMVRSMNASWSVPHFGYCDEVVMDGLMALRATMKPLAEERGVKLSYLPIMLKAASLALKQFPSLNANVNPECTEVVQRGAHNLGIAMDTPRGLVVPNVKNVESRSILEIAHELMRLQQAGGNNALTEADLTGGTFTLSNIGVIGGTYASPILMPPQVAIGALGKVERLPRYASADGDEVVPVHVMKVSWAADHRVVDGATMARFSNLWKAYLESPTTLIADMK